MSKTDKPDWDKLQVSYLAAQQATGISVRDWCAAKGLNYQTARRHIKAAAKKSNKPRGKAFGKDNPGEPFKPGNEVGKDTRFKQGNKAGVPNLHPGNTHGTKTVKHGAYARYFPIEVLQDVAASLGLPDELMLSRARIHSLMRSLEQIQIEIETSEDADQKASLYRTMMTAEQHLNRYISQVESIHKTLLVNDYTVVATDHKRTDMSRIKEQAAKLRAEREKLERDTGGSQSPLADAVRDIQRANSGLINASS
ncbi:hypothetical protein HNR62_001041 [Oceanisphaera litoralis]|uniref:hypothetical protein n=1 Tax=Oceanisphaera litoralis TaxID=225144 RepID=UPI0019574ABB|nr:hypothetical protein [Oceanisphaera litoralis]MBM7455181.1 hypothetical protein [Oceanisphaera litoralis]